MFVNRRGLVHLDLLKLVSRKFVAFTTALSLLLGQFSVVFRINWKRGCMVIRSAVR